MPTISFCSNGPAEIHAFLATLGSQSQYERTDQPPWFEQGVTVVVDESIYDHFQSIGRPRACGDGWFVVGHGVGPFRIFWRSESNLLARELTEQETRRFGELCGVSLIAWTNVD